MGIFSRRRERDHLTNGESHRREKRHRRRHGAQPGGSTRPLFDLDSGHFNRRPSFGQWYNHSSELKCGFVNID